MSGPIRVRIALAEKGLAYERVEVDWSLAHRYEPHLYPRDLAERARCRQLEAAADEILFPHVWTLIDQGFYPAAGGARDTARLDAARAGIARYAAERDKELADRAWLCGEFSVADIGTFVFLHAAATLGAPVSEEQANLRAWQERALARPAIAKEVAELRAFVAGLFAPKADQASAR